MVLLNSKRLNKNKLYTTRYTFSFVNGNMVYTILFKIQINTVSMRVRYAIDIYICEKWRKSVCKA